MVSATATDVDCSILAGMTPTVVTLDAMRSAMRLAGFAWSDAELDALRPGLERALASLDELERLPLGEDRKSTRLNSIHDQISYAVLCLKKKNEKHHPPRSRPPPRPTLSRRSARQ